MANNKAKRGNKTDRRLPPDVGDDERIVDPNELLERIPLDRSTIWRMVQEGRFPPPIQLTASRIGWRWSAILRWLSDREQNPVESRSYFGRDKATQADPPTITVEADVADR